MLRYLAGVVNAAPRTDGPGDGPVCTVVAVADTVAAAAVVVATSAGGRQRIDFVSFAPAPQGSHAC